MIAEKIFNLKDKVFIVAGGSGQLGFSLSEVLSKMGAQVAIVDLDIENANEKIKLSSEKNISTFTGDITDEENIEDLIKTQIVLISTGPERDQTILLDDNLF